MENVLPCFNALLKTQRVSAFAFLRGLNNFIYIYIYSCASHCCQNKILLNAIKNMRNYSKDIGMVSLRL